MSHSNSDFFNKLYAIKPFIETQSPPSSDHKPNAKETEMNIKMDGQFKIPDASINEHSIGKVSPLRRAVSENPCNDYMITSESNNKTLTSISSTIDILFSKIQKIKEQFSYALRPSSETQLDDISTFNLADMHFHSEKIIIENEKQNENTTSISRHSNSSSIKCQKVLHMHSLPLIEHSQNSFIQLQQQLIQDPFQSFQIEEQVKPQLKISDFHLGKCVGSGKFGDVYLSIHKQTNFMCAIKKVFKSTIKDYNMQEQFTKQLRIHYKLNHPNIVKLYGHFEDDYHIFLMMEYANNGVLMDKLKSSEEFVSQCIDQLLEGVTYLHRNKVLHRDIKPENVVVFLDSTVKICDFGWATFLQNTMKKTFCGTLDYVSPEMKDVGEYNESVDLWSIGVLTFQLLTGFPPYKHEISNWKLFGSKRNMKWSWEVLYPPQISSIAEKFISNLLKEDPNQRVSILECKNSFFIKKYRSQCQGSFFNEFTTFFNNK